VFSFITDISLWQEIPTFYDYIKETRMSTVDNDERYIAWGTPIWKKSKVDYKGRTVLPQELCNKLHLSSKGSILWISMKQGRNDNIFIIEVGVR
jgi:hypothetical protein